MGNVPGDGCGFHFVSGLLVLLFRRIVDANASVWNGEVTPRSIQPRTKPTDRLEPILVDAQRKPPKKLSGSKFARLIFSLADFKPNKNPTYSVGSFFAVLNAP
jgi:hypothetical protein